MQRPRYPRRPAHQTPLEPPVQRQNDRHLSTEPLYVHIPFCTSRCRYCDFYSIVLNRPDAADLIEVLQEQLRRLMQVADYRPSSIYIGGGTPTCLPTDLLEGLLRPIKDLAARNDRCEVTVEANPSTLQPALLEVLLQAGVNRISIGVQSLRAQELALLGRDHLPEQAIAAVLAARRAGFANISIDLIYGLPGQTLAHWRETLLKAIDLQPQHISCYELTLEAGTALAEAVAAGQLEMPPEDLVAEMFLAAHEMLTSCGYEHYEISNYALPHFRCRHNLAYWRNLPYVGLGPSAAGYVHGWRYKFAPDLRTYVDGYRGCRGPEAFAERLGPVRRAMESAMLALRTADGIPASEFAERFGQEMLRTMQETLEPLAASGLVQITDARITPTLRGMLLQNALAAELLALAGDEPIETAQIRPEKLIFGT